MRLSIHEATPSQSMKSRGLTCEISGKEREARRMRVARSETFKLLGRGARLWRNRFAYPDASRPRLKTLASAWAALVQLDVAQVSATPFAAAIRFVNSPNRDWNPPVPYSVQ